MQRTLAIAWLTWKAAFRFRLFLVLAALLLASVVGLPLLLKDDGTARGFTQILLTYTLSVITALLGLSTLWLACGTLARDIEESQIQMVATKPIARWQIWLGKWLGLATLNAALLALSGAAVFGMLQWRATRLPADEQRVLREEVLVARGSAQEASWDQTIDGETDQALKARLAKERIEGANLELVRRQIREQVKAAWQNVPPGELRVWRVDLGARRGDLRDQPLQLRIKFNAAQGGPNKTFTGLWQIGDPEKGRAARLEPMSLAPDTYHEFAIPPNLLDAKGVLTVTFVNANDSTLLFPLEDGLAVLYRESSFGGNFMRGLGIIFCWMALLSTLGLAAASLLSFPVAAFFSLAVLTVGLSSGTLTEALANGTVAGVDEESGAAGHSLADVVILPAFRAVLHVINLVEGYSPIDALSSGRNIPWSELGAAFGQVVLLLGGALAAAGVALFYRRELAAVHPNQ
jgi:hypothetical protein